MTDKETMATTSASSMTHSPNNISVEGNKKNKHKERKTKKALGGVDVKSKSNVVHSGLSQQQQRDKEFTSHKQIVLSNLASNACDHSPKGGVDGKCFPLMDILNTHGDYITTSSCSGRIALFHSGVVANSNGNDDNNNNSNKDKGGLKRGDAKALGWLVVKHGPLSMDETEAVVHLLCGDHSNNIKGELQRENLTHQTSDLSNPPDGSEADGELDGVWVQNGRLCGATDGDLLLPRFGCVSLKVEPFVMHIECRTMESAKCLLSAAASDSGFRNSGVTPPGKKIMCAIRQAAGHGLDTPLMMDGVNYVKGQHAYVRRLLQLANEKMQGNDAKIRRLEESVAARLAKTQ